MTVWPSQQVAEDVAQRLAESGVIVRPISQFGVPNGIRITIGSDEQNEMLIAALHDAVSAIKKEETGELVCKS